MLKHSGCFLRWFVKIHNRVWAILTTEMVTDILYCIISLPPKYCPPTIAFNQSKLVVCSFSVDLLLNKQMIPFYSAILIESHLLICAIYSGLYKKVILVFGSVRPRQLSLPFLSSIGEPDGKVDSPAHICYQTIMSPCDRGSAQGWSVFRSLSPCLYRSLFLQRCQGTCAVNVKRSPFKAFQKKPLCSRPHIGDCKTYGIWDSCWRSWTL